MSYLQASSDARRDDCVTPADSVVPTQRKPQPDHGTTTERRIESLERSTRSDRSVGATPGSDGARWRLQARPRW
eukprot:927747-Pyramimonas_sp.AAC.1